MGDESDQSAGQTLGDDAEELGMVLGDAYRGELDRETTWRSRLDQTTTWSVMVLAAILTWAFSSPDNPHYILLVGVVVLMLFCWIEARRYRDYDVYRSRVRLFQENLFATVLDPSSSAERPDWRLELGEDYRHPTFKISMYEAVSNRLRRIYLALVGILGAAWLFRVSAYVPGTGVLEEAAIGTVPGVVIFALVGAFYVITAAVTLWPHERQAKEEFAETEAGDWK